MKRYLALLLTAAMCVCCLALAACGGGASDSAASGSEASSSAAAADPAEKFIGEWKVAGAEMEGITITGNLSGGLLGEGTVGEILFSFDKDGTGSASYNDESFNFAWETKGDNAVVIKPTDDNASVEEIEATYENGALSIEMSDDSFSGKVLLSQNGSIEGMEPIDTTNAKNLASKSDAVGTWKLCGMNMSGMSMYGDADNLASVMGDSTDSTITLNEDGTAEAMGTAASWEFSADGSTINIGIAVPLMTIDDMLALDMSELIGSEFVMLFSK